MSNAMSHKVLTVSVSIFMYYCITFYKLQYTMSVWEFVTYIIFLQARLGSTSRSTAPGRQTYQYLDIFFSKFSIFWSKRLSWLLFLSLQKILYINKTFALVSKYLSYFAGWTNIEQQGQQISTGFRIIFTSGWGWGCRAWVSAGTRSWCRPRWGAAPGGRCWSGRHSSGPGKPRTGRGGHTSAGPRTVKSWFYKWL